MLANPLNRSWTNIYWLYFAVASLSEKKVVLPFGHQPSDARKQDQLANHQMLLHDDVPAETSQLRTALTPNHLSPQETVRVGHLPETSYCDK
jgi:hypothetical protein